MKLLQLGSNLCLIILTLLCASCEENFTPSAAIQKSKDSIKPIAAENILNVYFESHPNWDKNNVKEQESYRELEGLMKTAFKSGDFLKNMPFKLDGIVTYENGVKGYLCNFNFDNSWFSPSSKAYLMSMQLFGIVDSHMKDELLQGRDYFLTGKFIMFRSGMVILKELEATTGIYLPKVRMKVEKAWVAFKD